MTDLERINAFLSENRIEFRQNEKLSEYSSFRIGGRAELIVMPKTANELAYAAKLMKENGIRYLAVGNMTNLLFDDEGFDGAIICTRELRETTFDGDIVTAGAGASLTRLASEAGEKGLKGLEFAYGIPGSVGGAVFMNAGAYGGEMKDIVTESTAYSPETGKFVTLKGDKHEFGYRHSAYMENGLIVVSAKIALEEGSRDEIKARMNELMARRKDKQPLEFPSVGSVFKRCEGRYTGQMIEQSGLKGFSVGGAQVSEKHAGFIINRGGATAKDVLELVSIIKERIKKDHGVDLECEMRYIPRS